MSDEERDLQIEPEGEDISFDDASGDAEEKVKKLRQKLRDCQKDKEEYLSGWQRCKADFVNAKKVEERDRLSFLESANESLIKELLPVLDSFDLALNNQGQGERVNENWRAGFLGIYSNLTEVLVRRGLAAIGKAGEKLNLKEHEPVAEAEVADESQDETVTEVLQKGYILNGRVIRPAKVRVGQYKK